MRILRLSTLTLTIAVLTLGIVESSSAGPKNCEINDHRPSCYDDGSGGNGGGNECQMSFSVEFRDGVNDGVLSDGDPTYPDPNSKDKTLAIGGEGGFRLDTNGSSQKTNGAGGTRELRFREVPVSGYNDFKSGADFRFHLGVPQLVLCSLDEDEDSTVPMILHFADSSDAEVEYRLLYGCIGHLGGNFTGVGSNVTVTRTLQQDVTEPWTPDDTWTIVGTSACLILAEDYATGTDSIIANDLAPFSMTITALDP